MICICSNCGVIHWVRESLIGSEVNCEYCGKLLPKDPPPNNDPRRPSISFTEEDLLPLLRPEHTKISASLGYYVDPEIPPKKLAIALKSCESFDVRIPEGERILSLATYQSAKDCVLYTCRAVYFTDLIGYSGDFIGCGTIPYSEFPQCRFHQKGIPQSIRQLVIRNMHQSNVREPNNPLADIAQRYWPNVRFNILGIAWWDTTVTKAKKHFWMYILGPLLGGPLTLMLAVSHRVGIVGTTNEDFFLIELGESPTGVLKPKELMSLHGPMTVAKTPLSSLCVDDCSYDMVNASTILAIRGGWKVKLNFPERCWIGNNEIAESIKKEIQERCS